MRKVLGLMGPEQRGVSYTNIRVTRPWAQGNTAQWTWLPPTYPPPIVSKLGRGKREGTWDTWGRAQEGTRVWFGNEVPLLRVQGGGPQRQRGRLCSMGTRLPSQAHSSAMLPPHRLVDPH